VGTTRAAILLFPLDSRHLRRQTPQENNCLRAFGFFRNFAAAFLLSAVLSGCAGIFPFEEKTADTPSSRSPATAQKAPRKETRRMLVTAYDPGPRSTGWKYHHGLTVYTYGRNKGKVKKVGITSDGSKAKVGTIAADISIYPYGTRIFVPGYGWGEVHDVGQAIKGHHIDIFFNTEAEALAWGKKSLNVTVLRPDTASAEYRRNLKRKLEIAADLRKRLLALAREQNCRERDLLAEAVEDLLRKYEKNGGNRQNKKGGRKGS